MSGGRSDVLAAQILRCFGKGRLNNAIVGLAILYVCCPFLAYGEPANAGPDETSGPDGAYELLKLAFDNLYSRDVLISVKLVTETKHSRPVTRQLQIVRDQGDVPGRALIRFVSPEDIRGTSILILNHVASASEVFVYFPALRMTRRISGAQRTDMFFGTALSYEDIEPKSVDDYVSRRIIRQDRSRGCDVVEVRTSERVDSAYDRVVLCIAPETGVLEWIDYFSEGSLRKRMIIEGSSIVALDTGYIPFRMTMHDLARGVSTAIVTERYETVSEIPDYLFGVRNLESGNASQDRRKAIGK